MFLWSKGEMEYETSAGYVTLLWIIMLEASSSPQTCVRDSGVSSLWQELMRLLQTLEMICWMLQWRKAPPVKV